LLEGGKYERDAPERAEVAVEKDGKCQGMESKDKQRGSSMVRWHSQSWIRREENQQRAMEARTDERRQMETEQLQTDEMR